ncbi:MAG: endolytic transglycosylase MltG [Steroidobacterales bacterium]
MRTALRAMLVVAVLVVAAAAWLVWQGFRSLDEPLTVASVVRFKVMPGTNFSRVAADLHTQGILPGPRAWVWYARSEGYAAAIKAGEYAVMPGMTPRELLGKMLRGEVVFYSFTIIDGWRVRDLLDALRRNPDLVKTLPDRPADLMQRLGYTAGDPEGQFLAETYRFESGATDIEILQRSHVAMLHELQSAWQDHDPAIPLKSVDELLTLASIVEKETAVPAELAKVAGLYLHRLAIGMRLQADPTVIYGLGDRYDGDLHTVDLRADGPYNSYTRTGLPPTPIALPGAAAIRASAHPEQTDALYFVASDKDDGSHVFSATLPQQNAAVARYVAHQRAKAAQARAP